MRSLYKAILLTVTICLFIQAANAQKPVQKNTVTQTKKFKQPKLYTTLGSFKDSSFVSPEEAEAIIAMPLKIVDDKKVEYTVSSYQFLYKRKVVTEDEQTGEVSPASSISSDRFKSSPLPPLWINIIRDQVKSGEELYFFDVIAKDAQGRVMYASNLKLMVK